MVRAVPHPPTPGMDMCGWLDNRFSEFELGINSILKTSSGREESPPLISYNHYFGHITSQGRISLILIATNNFLLISAQHFLLTIDQTSKHFCLVVFWENKWTANLTGFLTVHTRFAFLFIFFTCCGFKCWC